MIYGEFVYYDITLHKFHQTKEKVLNRICRIWWHKHFLFYISF